MNVRNEVLAAAAEQPAAATAATAAAAAAAAAAAVAAAAVESPAAAAERTRKAKETQRKRKQTRAKEKLVGREAEQRLELLELQVSRLQADLRRVTEERDIACRQARDWEEEANLSLQRPGTPSLWKYMEQVDAHALPRRR